MGLFDSIKMKVGNAAGDYKNAYTWAQDKDVRTICEAMQEAEGTAAGGYSMALQEKCRDMETAELKKLYYEFRERHQRVTRVGIGNFGVTLGASGKPADIIGDILVARGIFKRDENGMIRD